MKPRLPAPAQVVPWLLLVIAFALVFTRLSRPALILPLLRPWCEIGILAFGMTAVILTGGIDLSIGSIVGLCGVVTGLLWQKLGWPIFWAAFAGIGVGLIAGAINGALIVVCGIRPLVATLATMATFSGLGMALSRGERVTGFPDSFTQLGQGEVAGLPNQFILLGLAFLVVGLAVHKTYPGRWLFSIGDNRLASEFAAIPIRQTEWWLYALNGFLAGIVALWYTARRGASVADAGSGLELQVIACVVLGGTRITGGYGSLWRTMLGLVVLAHLEIGLRLWGSLTLPWTIAGRPLRLDANLRLIVVGLLLVLVAVVNERMSLSRREVT